jgi:hypothetical protein
MAENPKSEKRNPKEFQKEEKGKMLNKCGSGTGCFGHFRFPPFGFVSDFVFRISCFGVCLLGACLLLGAAPPASSYTNDFEKSEVGVAPADMLILDGAFAVQSFENNKVLELPGEPLSSFGAMFGPEGLVTGEVSGRVWGDVTGRRSPEFGLGSNDAGGYKLWVWPDQRVVELRKNDQAVATAPFDWKPRTWTRLRLSVRAAGEGKWVVEGKVWPDGAAEPAAWSVKFDEAQAPPAGRASIWGNPYSGKPIRFDDLKVSPQGAKQ